MKAKNLTINKFRFDWRLPEYSLIGAPVAVAAYQYVVTPGAMIHGNFRDPNNWSYTVNDLEGWRGERLRWEAVSKYLHVYRGPIGGTQFDIDLPTWNRTLMYNRALERLNSKVRGNLDLAIDIAERRQTYKMIRGIRNVLDFARSRRFSTRDVANAWLQWQYGWRPLLSDIYDACDEGQRTIRKALTKVRGSATERNRVNYYKTKQIIEAPQIMLIQGQDKQSCHIDVELEPRGWDPGQWSSLNPVSLAWELIPYSFVVDWFVDVGSWMRNLESALLYGAIFKSGYSSELHVYDGREEAATDRQPYLIGNGDPSGTWSKYVYATASRRHRSFIRTKLTSYPLPRTPTFKVDLGSQRLFSAAALLRQLLK